MSPKKPLPDMVSARLAPFASVDGGKTGRTALEDLDVEASLAVAPHHDRRLRLSLVNDLKLLFAAMGAGNSVVPMGDNGRATRQLAAYAESLRRH
jgi:hypothetical protein